MNEYQNIIGKTVNVTIDRPLGTYHPRTNSIFYTVNYGYVEGVIAGDGSEQDVYVLGVKEPLESFRGVVIAVIHRLNDAEDKWVAAPEGITFTKEEILVQTHFVEQFFQIEVYC